MRIDGAWRVCDDGIVRPVLRGRLLAADGTWLQVAFLLDSGADRSVLSCDVLNDLALAPTANAVGLAGVGGKVESVTVETELKLDRENGTAISIHVPLAAFTEPEALDMSVLGRDITNLFAVLIDRPQDVVCLLGGNHRYTIVDK